MAVCEIENLEGEVIFTYDLADKRWIEGNYDLSDANLDKGRFGNGSLAGCYPLQS